MYGMVQIEAIQNNANGKGFLAWFSVSNYLTFATE